MDIKGSLGRLRILAVLLAIGLCASGIIVPVAAQPNAIQSRHPDTRPAMGTITVVSRFYNGTEFDGMYMELVLNGVDVAAGYTPIVFHVKVGAIYQLYADSWQDIQFQVWSQPGPNPLGVGVGQAGVNAPWTAFYGVNTTATTV
jgi:hypothetical protein